jgi:tetratricopeptide (TPR) repeat protein
LQNFDWAKAQACFKHALELDSSDYDSRGKLALCNGYALIAQNPKSSEASQTAKTNFEEAVTYLPRSPDPHLGLARIYIYEVHNVGRALAELHEAERLGFRPGPREREQQADGYLFRAEQELRQAQSATVSKADRSHNLLLAERDLERARDLYEPIDGFSNVTANLQQLRHDESQRQTIQAQEQAKRARYRHVRYRSWR